MQQPAWHGTPAPTLWRQWIDSEAKRLLRRRGALCDELSRFCDVQRTLAKSGVGRLYLAHASKPEEKVRDPATRQHVHAHVTQAI